jgi:GAF domain-containing protein
VLEARRDAEHQRLVDEQTALRRVATLVAAGAGDVDLIETVTAEIAQIFSAHRASALRWDGDSIRVIGEWSADGLSLTIMDRVYPFGGDTITARVVNAGGPARIESLEDLHTEFAKERWAEFGIQAAIGAPIMVDGHIWGLITASRTTVDDPFPAGAEHRLGDFAALVAQAIANSEARQQVAALAEEQTALRRVATLVAGGRPREVVIDAVLGEVVQVFTAQAAYFVCWEGVYDEVVVIGGCSDGTEPALPPRSLYHPEPGGATLTVLETGFAGRTDESSPELGERAAIAAPVIVQANLEGALVALRPAGAAFPAKAEIRLRSFADLISRSIANAKYAKATAVEVRICRREGYARVDVVDDGVGGADVSRGSGLRGLADRVEALDGRLGVESPPSRGTRVWAEIPLG